MPDSDSENNDIFESQNLLVVNYTMSSQHPLLGHQIDVVRELARFFSTIIVLTTEYHGEVVPLNVSVEKISWKPNRPLKNALSLISAFERFTRDIRFDAIFSHMSTRQSLVLGPFAKYKRIPHYLWYAHKANGLEIRICSKLVTKVLSSTAGSHPLPPAKVLLLGQGVDKSLFPRRLDHPTTRYRLLHVGRNDSAKNIDLIVRTVEELRSNFPDLKLTLVGPGSELINGENREAWLTTYPSVGREKLRSFFESHDAFIHAYEGSLDKTLIEATLMGLPVITINNEFNSLFRTLGYGIHETLKQRVIQYLTSTDEEIRQVCESNFQISKSQHELANWSVRLASILKSKGY